MPGNNETGRYKFTLDLTSAVHKATREKDRDKRLKLQGWRKDGRLFGEDLHDILRENA